MITQQDRQYGERIRLGMSMLDPFGDKYDSPLDDNKDSSVGLPLEDFQTRDHVYSPDPMERNERATIKAFLRSTRKKAQSSTQVNPDFSAATLTTPQTNGYTSQPR